MSEITRSFEFAIFQAGSTTTVELTFTDEDFVRYPEYQTWDVDPLEARAESEPFEVEILDTTSQVTAALSGTDGRVDMIGRYWRLRINENGGGLSTVATGRVIGVIMSPTLGSYIFRCGDEMYRMRNYDVYTDVGSSPTTQIWPPGLIDQWQRGASFPPAGEAEFEVESTDASRVDSDAAVHLLPNVGTRYALSPQVVEWIAQDLKDNVRPGSTGTSTGNFTNLRFRTSGADYEVIGFNASINNTNPLGPLRDSDPSGAGGHVRFLDLWVAWDGSQPTAGDFIDGYLYAPNAPVSETVPLHIGGEDGVDLFSEWKDRLDDAGIEYNTNAFSAWDASTNPDGLIGRPDIGRGYLRITEPLTLEELGSRIMRNFLIAPFQDGEGKLFPRSLRIPNGVTVSSLTEVDASDFTRDGHPTFHIDGTQVKTVVQARIQTFRRVLAQNEDTDWAADKVVMRWLETPPREHDRLTELGRHVQRVDFWGVGFNNTRPYATELFDRFGDGPIDGVWKSLSATDSIVGGDFVRLTLPSYPNMGDQSRGSTRVVQVMQITRGPMGARMKYLDAGSDDQALATPGVTVAQNSARNRHDIDVNITTLDADAETCIIEALIAGQAYEFREQVTATGIVTLSNFPANTQISVRAKAIAPNRVGSAWSTPVSVTTAALTAPTGFTATASGATLVGAWTDPGEGYPLELTVDGAVVARVFPLHGSSVWVFTGLDPSTSYTVGVRAYDPYGGVSALATDTTSTSTAATLAAPRGIVDRALAYDAVLTDTRYGTGIDVGVISGEPHAKVEIQVDAGSSFSSPTTYYVEDRDFLRIPLPLDDTTRYVRARHRMPVGFTSSAWTQTISMKPQPFTDKPAVMQTDRKLKTITIPASEMVPFSDSAQWSVQPSGLVNPGALSTTLDIMVPLVLPEGAVIQEFRARVRRNDSSDAVSVALKSVDEDASATTESTLTASVSGSGFGTEEATALGVTVAAPGTYVIQGTLTAVGTASHAGLLYVQIVYEEPTIQEVG